MGKQKKKPIRVVKRKTPSRETMRVLIFNKPVFGKNHHQFKGKMTDHLHFGESLKLVYRPKELRGLYIKSQKGREVCTPPRLPSPESPKTRSRE